MNWFNFKNITGVLRLSYILIFIIFFSFCIFATYSSRTASQTAKNIYNHPLIVSNAALQGSVCLSQLHREIERLITLTSPQQATETFKTISTLEENVAQQLDIIKQNILGSEGQQLAANTQQSFTNAAHNRKKLLNLVKKGKNNEAATIIKKRGKKRLEELEDQLFSISQYARNKADGFMIQAQKDITQLSLFAFILFASGLLFTTFIALITLKKTAHIEKELRDSKSLLTNAIDFAPIGMTMVDVNTGVFIKANSSYCEMLGYSEKELNSLTFQDITVKEDYNIGRDITQKLLTGEIEQASIEKRYVRKNGVIINASITTSLLKDPEGRPLFFFSQSQDISERKKAEQEIKESEEKYRMLFKAASDAILLIDQENLDITAANEKAVQLYGYSHEELLTMKVTDLSAEVDKTISASQDTEDAIIPLRYQVKKDGTIFPTEITTNYCSVDNKIINISSIRDMSEFKKIEHQLAQSRKMESIGTLAGGIAHDFNNMLAAIIGFTELSLDDAEKGSILEENLQEIFTAGNRAKELVSQILAFARHPEQTTQPVRFDKVVSEVLQFLRNSFPATIKINKHIVSKSYVLGNAGQFHQVMMNLCTNAAQAMSQQNGELDISLTEEIIDQKKSNTHNLNLPTGNYVKMEVTDNGPGIPPQIIDSIFEPYFTTKHFGEGTGMGLAVVHGIIESFNGRIYVQSTPGIKTVFTIYLPTIEPSTHIEVDHPVQQLTGSETILYVDDEEPIVRMAKKNLESLGYRVITATKSIEALRLFRANPNDFSAVITDMTMPDMTGDKLAEHMRIVREDIPIILLTGYSQNISEKNAMELGFQGFAYKPIIKANLAKLLRKSLNAQIP